MWYSDMWKKAYQEGETVSISEGGGVKEVYVVEYLTLMGFGFEEVGGKEER